MSLKEDNEIIIIELSFFKNRYIELLETNNENLSNNIKDKYNELIKNYNCFNTKYDPKSVWEKKNFKKKNTVVNINNTKKTQLFTTIPYNINDDKNKRLLLGLLNKITDNNKENILESINELITITTYNELFNVVINYISYKYDIININILKFFEKFNKNIIYNEITDYIKYNKWEPDNNIINKNILDDNYYDEYCDYVKWKNKEFNKIKTFIYIFNTDINKYKLLCDMLAINIYNSFINNVENNIYKYILDYKLELLSNIYLSNLLDKEIIKKLHIIDLTRLDKSTKFLILDIIHDK